MKCLNCGIKGSHFERKICPKCVSQGISRDDLVAVRRSDWFTARSNKDDEDAGVQAGKFITKLEKERAITHLKYKYSKEEEWEVRDMTKAEIKDLPEKPKKGKKPQVHVKVEVSEMEVSWLQYELKDTGATNGRKKTNKS